MGAKGFLPKGLEPVHPAPQAAVFRVKGFGCRVLGFSLKRGDTVDDINPALPIFRKNHDSHSLGSLR